MVAVDEYLFSEDSGALWSEVKIIDEKEKNINIDIHGEPLHNANRTFWKTKIRSQTFMLMLCAGRKKAINRIISILSCGDKVVAVGEQRNKKFAFMEMSKALNCGVQFKHENSKGETKQHVTL